MTAEVPEDTQVVDPCGECGHSRADHAEEVETPESKIRLAPCNVKRPSGFGWCTCPRWVPEAEATPAQRATQRANRVFGRQYNAIYFIPEPFAAGGTCSACLRDAVRRIMVNIWGTICEYDVCEEHAQMHGRRMDDFPLRPELLEKSCRAGG